MDKSERKIVITSVFFIFIIFSLLSVTQIRETNTIPKKKISIKLSDSAYGSGFLGTEVLDYGDLVKVYINWEHLSHPISWYFTSSNSNVSIKVMLMTMENYWDYHYGGSYRIEAILSNDKSNDSGNLLLERQDTTFYIVFLNNDASGNTTLTWHVSINPISLFPLILSLIIISFTALIVILFYKDRIKIRYKKKQNAKTFSQQIQKFSSSKIKETKIKYDLQIPVQTQDQDIHLKKESKNHQIINQQELKTPQEIKQSITYCRFCGKKLTPNIPVCLICGVKVKKKN